MSFCPSLFFLYSRYICKDIGDLAVANPELKMFVAILQSSGLFAILKEPGDYTLLAPNNAAIYNIKDRLQKLSADNQFFRDMITSHLLPMKIKKSDIKQGTIQVQTFGEKSIRITKSFMKIRINDKAEIIKGDIEGANGVIHIIDNVIIGKLSLALFI